MNLGSYVVVQIAEPERFLPAVTSLSQRDDVLHWKAIDGNKQLVVRLKPPPAASAVDDVCAIPGATVVTRLEILDERSKARSTSPLSCSAYVFIEIEPQHCDNVLSFLEHLDAVCCCSSVRDGSAIVALVQAGTFDSLDRVVNRSIRHCDGIIRLKVNRVIELQAM